MYRKAQRKRLKSLKARKALGGTNVGFFLVRSLVRFGLFYPTCACRTLAHALEIKRPVAKTSMSIYTIVQLPHPAIPCIFGYQLRLKGTPWCQDLQ